MSINKEPIDVFCQINNTSEIDLSEGRTKSVELQESSQRRKKIKSSTITAMAIIVGALLPKFLLIYTAKRKSKNRYLENHIY